MNKKKMKQTKQEEEVEQHQMLLKNPSRKKIPYFYPD
jgi:hypothetical protein